MTASQPSVRHLFLLFVAELRRRRVLRAAGLYLAGAWLVIQVASTMAEAGVFPSGWVTWLLIVAMLGFPVVVVLAWLFAFRVREAFAAETVPPELGLTPGQVRVSIALAAVAGAGLLALTGFLSIRFTAGGAASEPAPAVAALTTLQVLPFAAISEEPRHQRLASSFTQALAEELSRVPELTVFSGDVPSAAPGAPAAGTVVRGTLFAAGDSVRLVVELVHAATGRIIASERQERGGEDVLVLIDALVPNAAGFIRQTIGRDLQLAQWRRETKSDSAWELVRRANVLELRSHRLQKEGGARAALDDLAHADSLLAHAVAIDAGYTGAWLLRARVAYGRAYIHANPGNADYAAARSAIERGIAHANAVLTRAPGNAEAFEWRGQLQLVSAQLIPGDADERALLQLRAERDLRSAIALDPHRALALAGLAMIVSDRGELDEARSYLRAAYEEDAYVEKANEVLATLSLYAFELGEDVEAVRYCGELTRRWPNGLSTVFCNLQLDAWSPARTADVADAWRRVDRVMLEVPVPIRALVRAQLEVLAAGVIARAGLGDSARAVLARARAKSPDPELWQLEAGVRVQLGEDDAAVKLLRNYAAVRQSDLVRQSRRFARLPENPLATSRSSAR